MQKFFIALVAGVVAGVLTYILGSLFASVTDPVWLKNLGEALKNASGLVALVVFLWDLFIGFNWPNRVA